MSLQVKFIKGSWLLIITLLVATVELYKCLTVIVMESGIVLNVYDVLKQYNLEIGTRWCSVSCNANTVGWCDFLVVICIHSHVVYKIVSCLSCKITKLFCAPFHIES